MFLPAPGPAAGGVLLTFRGWIWEAGNSREIRDFLADCSAQPRIEGNAFSSIQREGNLGGIPFVPPEWATRGQRVMENGKGREILTFPGISSSSHWNLFPPSAARASFPFGSGGFQAQSFPSPRR